jgi:uncharacterized protein
MSDVVDNAAESRFELSIDGHLAIVVYRIENGAMYFTHTETPPQFEGQGVASRVAHAALSSAKARGLKIVPRCSFIAAYVKKHPEFQI